MGSRTLFAASLLARAAAGGGLLCLAVWLALGPHYDATALIVLGLAALLGLDLHRAVRRSDRALADLALALRAGALETPARDLPGYPETSRAIRDTAVWAAAQRSEPQMRIQELQALLDTVSSALLVLDPQDVAQLANRSALTLAGQPVLRLDQIEAIGPEAAARLCALAPGARAIVRIADGRRMLAACSSFSTPRGEPRRLIGLQSLSEELTAVELQAWQDLVRVLAHEMMNSLTPIASLSESLERLLQSDAEASDAVRIIARRSRGLMGFVARYRAMAELPAPEPQPIALADFVRDLDGLVGAEMRDHGVALSCAVEPRDLQACADPELLAQAVLNLLKNAREAAAAAASPAVSLDCRLQDNEIAIAICDNGPGLPEDPDRLFVPFFSTKRGGSGVGLTLARQIAQSHGGRLQALRNEDGGATFVLSLPARG